jgi:hypothetical protein
MDSPKFLDFNVQKQTYKVVNNHEISAYVLVPKSAPVGPKLPILVTLHGGFFVGLTIPQPFLLWQEI